MAVQRTGLWNQLKLLFALLKHGSLYSGFYVSEIVICIHFSEDKLASAQTGLKGGHQCRRINI